MMQTAEMGRRPAQNGEMLPLLIRHELQVLLRAGTEHDERESRGGTQVHQREV
jgi:hypothetical protein